MRALIWLFSVFAVSAMAEPDARPPVVEPVHPSWQLEWNNARPEQRQALDQFYQSLQRLEGGEQMTRRMEREQNLERLREMTPEQRQQQFMDFVHTEPMPPPPGGVPLPPPPAQLPPPPPPLPGR